MTDFSTPTPPSTRFRQLHSSAHQGMLAAAVFYGGCGLSMWLQPTRWTLTPAYHDIFQVAPQSTWAALFIVAAILLGIEAAICPNGPVLRSISVGLAMVLTATWIGAAIVRWKTSNDTTPEVCLSFLMTLFILWQANRAHRDVA